MIGHTSNTNIALQNLQPNAMYAVSASIRVEVPVNSQMPHFNCKVTSSSWTVTLQCIIVPTPKPTA